jgi:hypothetical protein
MAIVLALATLLASARASAQMGGGGGSGNGGGSPNTVILSFKKMVGVSGAFLDPANAIRGVEGDSLPWIVTSAKGTLTERGKLSIKIRGLIFPIGDPNVPPELQGTNDEEAFRAVVSCLTDNAGTMEEANVTTEEFPATTSGNAKIKAVVDLPSPCIAPIVFIVGDEGEWLAVTGAPATGTAGGNGGGDDGG